EAWTKVRSTAEVVGELFDKRGVPCAPLRKAEDVLQDPWLRRTGAIQTLSHPAFGPIDAVGPGVPVSFSDARSGFDRPTAELGADNGEIYAGLLEMDEAELADLKAQKII